MVGQEARGQISPAGVAGLDATKGYPQFSVYVEYIHLLPGIAGKTVHTIRQRHAEDIGILVRVKDRKAIVWDSGKVQPFFSI